MHPSHDNSKNRGQRLSLTPEYGKVPPQATELEKSVLGAITLEKEAFEIVAELLTPEVFYLESHQRIYRAMEGLQRKNSPIDLLTLMEELKSRQELDLIGGPFALTELQKNVTYSSSLLTHARIIYQKYHLRELLRLGMLITSKAYDDGTDNFELQDEAEKMLSDLGAKNIGEMVHISKVMAATVAKIEEWRNIEGSITGVPSGFSDVDRVTRGWQPGDLIVLAARPSVGKTAFALNLIKSAAQNTIFPTTVAVWSLEMKAIYLGLRMIAAESNVILDKLQTGKLTDEEMSGLIMRAADKLSELNIFFNESSHITMSSIRHKARRLKKKNNLGLIVIDYLQLMKGESKGNREREVAEMSRELKELAQELNIPIIALSQLSRDSGEKNVKWEFGPPVSSLRESGAIEQDADVIGMLWGPGDEDVKQDPSLYGKRRFRIAKQRNGVLKTVEFNFKSEIQLFERFDEMYNGPKLIPVVNYYEKEYDEDAPF